MQEQQHLIQMQQLPMMASYYPNNNNNVTTDHIQQYLDENKSLILKIVESQNSGKMSECAENKARLQRNLMYLAAIADSQPQPPNIHSQYPGGGVLQPGAHYLQQHQQQQQLTPQSLMAARSSMYGAQPYPSIQQQQQAMHSQLSMMNSGGSSGLMLQGEPQTGFPDFVRLSGGGSKQDNVEGRGGSDGGETSLYLKSSEDGN